MRTLALDDLTVPAPPPSRADWNDEGVVILGGLISDEIIDAYTEEWLEHSPSVHGWPHPTPYMQHEALRALCLHRPVSIALEALLGEPAGLHLNLTGWVSTERDWHQDSYLNPPHVGDAYASVWFALGDIHPDSGPFQYVPGSHRWPQVTREKIGRHVDLGDPGWPKHSETILSPLFEREIEARGAPIVEHLPIKGDVLIWSGRLLHRGSRARVPGMERRALIAHYSGVRHRSDMPSAVRSGSGWLFPL